MPEGGGTFVAVVGPSGAGKDSLIAAAASHFRDDARFMFVKRVITREAHGPAEDHAVVSPAQFRRMHVNGDFAMTWEAHGLCYGIPAAVLEFVGKGGFAVANCSRAALADAERLFPSMRTVHVTADIGKRAERLARRGRESGDSIAARLQREVSHSPETGWALVRNDGRLEDAVDDFIALLRRAAS